MQTITINKHFGSRLIGLGLFGLIILAGNVWAAPSAIEGIVKDPNGRPISGADIRIEGKNQTFSQVVKSDAKGHYLYNGLTAGATYRVSLLVNGAVKASINNVQTKAGDPTQLNFDLKKGTGSQASAPAKKGKHYVYMPAKTGTNLGGRWVEVDDDGQADTAGANNVQTANGAALRKMQSNSGAARGGN
jgi:Carboxypeptidase regulatory-like domain